jgi:hypothetical protein
MDFLKSAFEEQLELRTTKDGNVVIGGTPFTAVAILKADPDAYIEEFRAWLNDVWLPRQFAALEEILRIHGNRKRFADLCATLKNGELIPLVGSGMSMPTGLPGWASFLRAIRHHSSMLENELEELLSQWAYEEAVEQLAAAMPGRLFDERIEHDLRIENPGEICGAVMFLPELFDKLVLTTNLDDLLETMFEVRGRRFSHVLHGRTIGEYRKVKANSERVLLKFHGDCRASGGRVLGKAEYDEAYANGSPVREELTTIYRIHSLLCMGCSLNPDRTVGLLAEVAKIDSAMPKHYAFLQHPKKPDILLEREHFLTERDIFPIWYGGDHDESIQALFVGMLQYMGKL